MVFPALYLNWKTEGKYAVRIALMQGLEMSVGYDFTKKIESYCRNEWANSLTTTRRKRQNVFTFIYDCWFSPRNKNRKKDINTANHWHESVATSSDHR